MGLVLIRRFFLPSCETIGEGLERGKRRVLYQGIASTTSKWRVPDSFKSIYYTFNGHRV